jgi:membrane-associated phospholipid phosphatase
MKSSRSRPTLVLLAVACIALLILVSIPVALHINPPGDMALVRIAVSLRNDAGTQVIGILTFISSALPALLACAALSFVEWLRMSRIQKLSPAQAMRLRELWRAAWPLLAYAGALATNIALRILIGRLRPEVDYIPHILPEIQADFQRFSYPSGHAGATLVTFAALSILLWRYRLARWPVLLLSAFVIIGVGFGRVYLGVHWPSDVLAGYLIGAAWLAIALHLTHGETLFRK